MFQFSGCDFSVPGAYQTPTDHADVAWLDLKKYKNTTCNSTDWELVDLPDKCFITAKIPETAGTFKLNFKICGNLNR